MFRSSTIVREFVLSLAKVMLERLCSYRLCALAYRGGFNPPPPKFRSFDKAEPNSQFRGKYIRNCSVFLFHHPSLKNAEFRTPTPQDVPKKAVKF
jgi:hypothetical protein